MLAAVGGIFIAPVAARAETGYPIEPPASAVSAGTVPAGEAVIFSGKGFLAGEPIAIDVSFHSSGTALHTSDLAAYKTVTASSSGTFSTPITLGQSGKVTLTATGTISGVVVSEQVIAVVAEPSGSGGGGLAATGQPAGHWLTEIGLGVGAILVGALLVLAAVRLRGRGVRQI